MEQKGRIKKINGNIAEVAFIKKSGCGGNCSGCKGSCPSDMLVINIENTLNASVGDEVLVSIHDKTFSKMTFWAYFFPTIMTLLGLIGGIVLFKSLGLKNYELYGSVIGILFLLFSYIMSGRFNKRKNDNPFTFEMIRKI